jgi:hypothetical protein
MVPGQPEELGSCSREIIAYPNLPRILTSSTPSKVRATGILPISALRYPEPTTHLLYC